MSTLAEKLMARIFKTEDFDDKSKWEEIENDFPDKEKYEIESIKQKKEEDGRLMKSYYLLPVLSKNQEAFLFRKYNFFKYLFSLEKDEKYLEKIKEVKEVIVQANLRLIFKIYKKNNYDDEQLSDCYDCLILAIDYFDFRKNFKFSTYLVRMIYNNINKKRRKRSYDLIVYPEKIVDKEYDVNERLRVMEAKYLIKKMMKTLNERQMDVINKKFGIGCDSMSLKDIGKVYNVSKERISQVKDESLSKMRKEFFNYDLNYFFQDIEVQQ